MLKLNPAIDFHLMASRGSRDISSHTLSGKDNSSECILDVSDIDPGITKGIPHPSNRKRKYVKECGFYQTQMHV